MADLLKKPELYHLVAESFRASGWNVLYLPNTAGDTSLRLQVYKDSVSYSVRVYIWNMTPGGRNRPANEWRIQKTGVGEFIQEPDEQTLILGWWMPGKVFAGFDYKKHVGQSGKSPSLQIAQEALQSAASNVFAPYDKGNGEVVIAFQPGFIGEYVSQFEQLHAFGATDEELEVLDTLARNPEAVSESDAVIVGLDEPRRIALRSVRQRVRDVRFRDRVLAAYSHLCAICGMQLDLVEAAHIVPVADSRSIDHPRNGLALCVLHHRAFDNALVTIQSDFHVALNLQEIERLRATRKGEGETAFMDMIRKSPIHLPQQASDWPDGANIQIANELRGWASLGADQIQVF